MVKIPINKIIITGNNPRKDFDEEKLRELGESIKEYGQLQQIIVRSHDSDYELIIGERRLRACAFIGLSEIEAEVREVTDIESSILRLEENIHREDLTEKEKGDAIYALWALSEQESLKDLSEKIIKKPYGTIERWLQKSDYLSPKVNEFLVKGRPFFTESHAQALLKYPHKIQEKLANISIERKLSRRQFRELVKKYDVEGDKTFENTSKIENFKSIEVPIDILTEEQKKTLKTKNNKKSNKIKKRASTSRKTKKEVRKKFQIVKEKTKKPPPKPIPVIIDDSKLAIKHKIIMDDNKRMNELKPNSVHLIITSPPYFNAPYHYEDYFETYEEFLSLINNFGKESYRVLISGRIACINCDDIIVKGCKYPVTADIIKIFIECGFRYRDWILWQKPEGYMRKSRRSGSFIQNPYPMYLHLDNIFESILIFQKGNFNYNIIDKKIRNASILDISEINDDGLHLNWWKITNVLPLNRIEKDVAAFPEELPRRIIKLYSYIGETVLDPFLGSGTTTRVAAQLKRNSIGYEKDINLLPIIKDKIGINDNNKEYFEITLPKETK